MNRGTLPIVARLQSLQTASRFALGGGRVIAEAVDRYPLVHLLRAANETVLGRSLQFDSAAGPSLTLDVAGRRILRVSAAEGIPGAEACLAAEVLEDEHKDDLIKLLQAVASPRYELSVTSGLMGRGGEGVSVGLPVALIADLLLIELNGAVATDDPVDEPSVLETLEDSSFDPSSSFLGRFAAGLGPMLMAWLISGGSDDGRTDGPEEMVGHLQGFLGDEAEALSRQLDLLSNAPGGAVCIMLGATLIEGHSIVCARDSGAMFLGLIDGDGTKSVLKAWNAALG